MLKILFIVGILNFYIFLIYLLHERSNNNIIQVKNP